MKKTLTIITSLVLGTAVSQAAVLCTTTFNRTGTSLDTVTVNTVSDVGLSSPTSISASDFNKSTSGNDLLASGSIPSSVFSPNSNVGDNQNNTWSVSFTFTNTGSQDMLISSIDLSMIGFNAQGAAQNAGGGVANNDYVGGADGYSNKPINITLGMSGQENQTLAYNGATSTNESGSWSGIHTGSYEYDGVLLKAGESMTLTVTASKNENYGGGCFIGLTGIQVNGEVVPEPATASLGILGLAALMMRRRRL
ncbi:PEP-CTERM sorting domain-containing protein [Akkermansia sp.]|uniref:PEP-CTERM sorting domain-containing protein n=1 Tax=Akkermansia sp. TaxID=1872421 RepID=UPI0025BB9801|nr:PEP-CTERM sorting domain-containing protein [Akkermansia sp.]MCD8272498.1 PEP-CTERM sorting domain-containing protein [Akkermansia sp.]